MERPHSRFARVLRGRDMATEHLVHEGHTHHHGEGCGHVSVPHQDHVTTSTTGTGTHSTTGTGTTTDASGQLRTTPRDHHRLVARRRSASPRTAGSRDGPRPPWPARRPRAPVVGLLAPGLGTSGPTSVFLTVRESASRIPDAVRAAGRGVHAGDRVIHHRCPQRPGRGGSRSR
ncbi:hypothetical protein BJF83_07645 [Nocardiopsis sp. CNR-923]|nr:hypothetical protein BJF83_07645 [Nocardiopsis sp. CNR-923]